MAKPRDINLYNSIKELVYKDIPKHSAYRSGILVRKYKSAFLKKYNHTDAYLGSKPTKTGLVAWHKQEWRNSKNNVGYEGKKNEIYRPTRKFGKTPILMSDLTDQQKEKAKKIKGSGKRVNNFSKL